MAINMIDNLSIFMIRGTSFVVFIRHKISMAAPLINFLPQMPYTTVLVYSHCEQIMLTMVQVTHQNRKHGYNKRRPGVYTYRREYYI